MIENFNEVTILVVDDDDIDFMSIKRAFKKLGAVNSLQRAENGIEALEILRGNNPHTALKRPYIILLDLNMPKMNGMEFLEIVRQDDNLNNSVIFIMTTSRDHKDIVETYKHNVAGYVVKSDLDGGFLDMLMILKSYWRIVKLPH